MPDGNLVAAELREVAEGRLTSNRRVAPLAPLLEGDALARYTYIASHWDQIRSRADGDLPADVHNSRWCQHFVATNVGARAAQALQYGSTEVLSYLTGLTHREVDLSEARTVVRLLSEMRRDGFMGMFAGNTDAGKTNTALWLSLLALLDGLSQGADIVFATNIDTLEWADDRLQDRTRKVFERSAVEQLCREHDRVVCVLDELEVQANATTSNYEVNESMGELLTFKSKHGLVFFPIFHRTDGLGAAPVIRNHATYFMKQERREDDLGDDEYWCEFYEDHDADTGFRNMAYEVPVPPLQPDGDYDPDEPARFEIGS